MHITSRQTTALTLLVAALACGGEDPGSTAPPAAATPAAAPPSEPANGAAPSPPASTGAPVPSAAGATTPAGSNANEGVGPIDFPPPATAEPDSSGPGDAPSPPTAAAPVASGECPAPEMLQATLLKFAPADAELAELFTEYVTTEVGPLTCATSGTGGARTITQTIFVPPNTVYDGQGESLTADPVALACDLTPGEGAESQRPYFLLAPGASIKNVTINYPGCEGIHMMGNNVLENITWVDVGEDAASVRSYFPGGSIEIRSSEAHHAGDKTFQFNAPGEVLIQDFVGSDMGKLVRQNGGTQFEFHVDLNQVDVTGVVSAVVQSDSPLCFVRHHNLTFAFTGSGDKSDRVFREIPVENVTEY